MALRPLNRPAGSTQVLRYRGTIDLGGDDSDVYPKANAEISTDSEINAGFFTTWVRFALFDPGATSPPAAAADVANPARRLPENVYDDSLPAAEAPHAPVACVLSPELGINLTDLSLDRLTWAQNLQIHYTQIDSSVSFCDSDVSIDNDGANGAMVLLDNETASGLGLGTGLPVVAVRFVVAATGGEFPALQAFDIDITFEIRHTNHR